MDEVQDFDPFTSDEPPAPACFRRPPWARVGGKRKDKGTVGAGQVSTQLERWTRHHEECGTCGDYHWYHPARATVSVTLPSQASEPDVRVIEISGERIPYRITAYLGADFDRPIDPPFDPAELLCDKGWRLFVEWCVFAHFEYMKAPPGP